MTWLLLGAAGAAGALARHGLGLLAGRTPVTTLAVNVAGSFLLGLLLALAAGDRVSDRTALVLGTGFLGAFTTYSTFSVDLLGLLRDGRWPAASAYVAASVLLGLAAAAAGLRLGIALRA